MHAAVLGAFGAVGEEPGWREAREAEWDAADAAKSAMRAAVFAARLAAQHAERAAADPRVVGTECMTAAAVAERRAVVAMVTDAAVSTTTAVSATDRDQSLLLNPPSLAQRPPVVFTHHGVGCDICGNYPIRGRRFKCRDCPEAIGFDLCSACHFSNLRDSGGSGGSGGDGGGAADVRGRFNQNHRMEHRMEEIVPRRTMMHFYQEVHPDLSVQQILDLVGRQGRRHRHRVVVADADPDAGAANVANAATAANAVNPEFPPGALTNRAAVVESSVRAESPLPLETRGARIYPMWAADVQHLNSEAAAGDDSLGTRRTRADAASDGNDSSDSTPDLSDSSFDTALERALERENVSDTSGTDGDNADDDDGGWVGAGVGMGAGVEG
jgi:hypothetical protein